MEDRNLLLNTTRKKALEVMQKGIVSYYLATQAPPWDVAEHFGDGYDLVVMQKDRVKRIELKAIDLKCISCKSKSFTQSVSPNEVVNATHVIISVFDGVELAGNYIMTLPQLFEQYANTGKFSKYCDFGVYRKACQFAVQVKSQNTKGLAGKPDRLNLDISCSIEKFHKDDWKLALYKECWENLSL
jgi:hypothetical protein